ncbi:MAG: tetratricopeptide repeat protein [Candidatus Methylumidiphilus sp.]
MADTKLNLYNPATQDARQLLAEFFDRKDHLKEILDIIRHNGPNQPPQHVVIIGRRGMGKTTLLCAIKHSIDQDPALSAAWLPILFQEEQYGIGDLADFWLETLRHLEAALQRPSRAAEQLLDENPPHFAERAQERFFELLAQTGKRAVLLIDNLNDIFQAIDDGQALHTLRALWADDPRCTIVGAMATGFADIDAAGQPFHEFFRPFRLDSLNQEELKTVLRRYAQEQGDAENIERVIEQTPERIEALRILSGGNPRLVKLGYRVLCGDSGGGLHSDLRDMLEAVTPFFKHRIDGLAKESRRVFDAIARRWDPVTVDDIRRELRKPSNNVSAQIKRLIEEGFVEEAGGDKKKRYQVSERFYNVYYLMRHSREGRQRLRWLVGFMQTFYTRKDYKEWAKRLEGDLAGPLAEPKRMEKLAHLHALSAAADDDGRGAAFAALVRDAIAHDDRRSIDADTADGDPVESHGWRYLLAETVWLLPPDARLALGFRPNDAAWWQRLRQALGETGLRQAQTRLDELGGWRQDTPRHARAAGVMLRWLFKHLAEAEAAFRKALELDPQNVSAWGNLGVILAGENRPVEAEAAFRKALELDPQSADAWNGLGNLLSDRKRLAEAEDAHRKALELDPQHVLAWEGLGNVLSSQSCPTEAEAAYRKALEINPQYVGIWYNLGIAALYAKNCPAEAETAYRKALELDPQFGLAHINLGGIYLVDMGRSAEGSHEISLGLGLEPENSYGLWVLSRYWQTVLPSAAAVILSHSASEPTQADNLRSAMTNTLLRQAAAGQQTAVRDALLALDGEAQTLFEPLLLALQALDDRSLLYRIAREKRELVLDVMKSLEAPGL